MKKAANKKTKMMTMEETNEGVGEKPKEEIISFLTYFLKFGVIKLSMTIKFIKCNIGIFISCQYQ